MTIGTYGAVKTRSDKIIRLSSMNIEPKKIFQCAIDEIVYNEMDDWTNYPLGVIKAFEEKGYRLNSGFDILLYGNIPMGAGLSSSASTEVLIGLILKEIYGFNEISMQDIAILGQRAENNFVGTNCGIMDQFASAMGKKENAIFLDANTLQYKHAPLRLAGAHIVITNSGIKHHLASSEYNTRRMESEEALRTVQKVFPEISSLGNMTNGQYAELNPNIFSSDIIFRRGKHAVSENVRTIEAAEALFQSDIEKFGRLMNESHASLRDDYEVSCPEIDFLVERAWDMDDVIGSRMTGGGFGGCTVSIVKNSAIDFFKSEIAELYKKQYGIDAKFYVVASGDGAREVGV